MKDTLASCSMCSEPIGQRECPFFYILLAVRRLQVAVERRLRNCHVWFVSFRVNPVTPHLHSVRLSSIEQQQTNKYQLAKDGKYYGSGESACPMCADSHHSTWGGVLTARAYTTKPLKL